MSELQLIKKELSTVKELLELVLGELKRKPVNKRWLSVSEFCNATGLNRNQVNGLRAKRKKELELDADDISRYRAGIGVQIDYHKYKELYQ